MEKNRMYVFDPRQRLKKMLLVLKASILLLFAITFSLSTSATSQVVKLTMKMQDVTIDEMIKNVRTETTYRFLYRVEEVNKYGKRNIDVKDASINDFLNTLLAGTKLTYEIQNDVIIIRPSNDDNKVKAAPRVIKGKVLDEKGLTLPGATIILKGTKLGVTTDPDGKFKLEIPKLDSTILVISFIGMKTQEIRLKADTKDDAKEMIIRLQPDVTEMDEVVITGYANIRKESFTGNSVTVTRDDLMKVSKTNIIKALQTFDPSFRVQTSNQWGSDPNALPEMYIRGRSGIGVKELDKSALSKSALKDNPNLPTFIMDGFQISVQKLYDMDPSRIENITILKDAAATALYGSRAANGVVVITTVAPKPGKLNVSYSMTGEISMPDLTDYNLMNAAEKLETEKLAGVFDPAPNENDDYGDDKLDAEIMYNRKLANVAKGVDTYWLSLPLRTAFNHKHSLFIEGGSESLRFGVDLSYNNEDGVMKGSYRDRIGTGLYVDYRVGSFQARNQVSYNITKSHETPYGNFSDYTTALPYNVYKDENGRYLEELEDWGASGTVPNPLYESTLYNFSKSQSEEIINNFSLAWYITEYFQLKGQFSITKQMDSGKNFLDPLSKQNEDVQAAYNISSGQLTINDDNSFKWDMNVSAAYNRSFDKHNINAQLVVNSQANTSKSTSAIYRGFPSGVLSSPSYAEKIYQKPTTTENTTRLIGFLGSVNYSWNNIYLFDASVRLDGSSEFGEDKRFAPFWSFGAGFNIHNYSFMQGQTFIEQLKIRGSYGQTGKVNFAPHLARTTYEILSDEWYKNGFGATLKALGNKNLTWETTNKMDIGIELSILQRLLYVKGSYYNEKTVDLINSVTIPSSTGFTTYTDNIGEVRNTGFELELRSDLIKKQDWYLAVFGNLTHNKNKILKISESLKAYNDKVDEHFNSRDDEGLSKPFTKYVEGGSLTSIFGVQSKGIDPATGNEIFINTNGTLTTRWNANQQVVLGNTEPDASGSFGLNTTYKNFSLYVTFMYEFGGQQYNQTLVDKVEDANVYEENVDKRVLTERWQKPGDISKFKKLDTDGSVETTKPTSRFVQDNNFVSFNSVTLGYDLNQGSNWMKKIGVSMLRFEIGANDICRWSSIKAERGLSYPFARTMNFSLKASF